ncbi:cytochrome-c peroxidase [Thalassomonas viridans]|uniref:Methylamine utilization protein MauG n=1 Tax=Thalassomonas viridans TaxID=137584 RepID=A0AAE9YXS4_9GAMM|nr:cytochrome c peroxidase [Thalassomonas viridans]WDE03191.1 cytochrome-c peroxidase [Thalassomonas viridans]
MLKRIFLNLVALIFTLPLLVCAAELGTPSLDDIEYPDDEPPSAAEIELGKVLFFDPRLSLNEKQSCATCHNPELGFGDGMATGIGTMGEELHRNTPHIYNLAWSSIFFWDGRAKTLEEQALGPIVAPGEMNLPLPQLLKRLKKVPGYQKLFKAAYGDSGITETNIARAISAFERSIITRNSSFDRYIQGDKNAMDPAAIRGLALFEGKARCTKCHDGVNFTDDSFHNIGVANDDVGREKISKAAGMKGAFKTPGLRNVWLTAPYMHDGSEPSLEAVIRFYNKGAQKPGVDKLIQPLDLTEDEIMDLLAFLAALTDPIVIERPKIP